MKNRLKKLERYNLINSIPNISGREIELYLKSNDDIKIDAEEMKAFINEFFSKVKHKLEGLK